jgi:hypothetical protein
MSSRSLFQCFKHFEMSNEVDTLEVGNSYPTSKEEARKQMVDLLLQSSFLYKKNEKSLTKKEKNSYIYYANSILYKIIYNFLQEYYAMSSSSSFSSFSSNSSSIPTSPFSPLKKLSFLSELTKLFLSYFALTPINRVKYESIFSKEFVNSLYNEIDKKLLEDVDTEDEEEEERLRKDVYRGDDNDRNITENEHDSFIEEKSDSPILSSFYKAENRLWILLLFSVKNLLELRKKDPFHFQAQYRLSLILNDLVQIKPSVPSWITQSLVVPRSTSSSSSSVDQPQQSTTAAVFGTETSGSRVASDPFLSENQSSENNLSEFQSQQYQSVEEVPQTASMISYFVEEPFITNDPDLLKITNNLLLSFLSDLSVKKSFLEMNKLFERRLPQIVAMWHDHIPDNPWEKVNR